MRRRARLAVVCSVAALSMVLLGSLASAAPVRADADPAASVPDAERAADETTATAIAAEYGHPVAIDSLTTPTSQTSAQPDGSMELMSSSVPVRVEEGSGWVPVDTSLTTATDGMVAPKESAVPVEFSAGGSTTLAKVQTASGQWVTETWPAALPSPHLNGSTATYGEVFPGVDLKLTATATGMSEVLVVKSASAAANPALQTLKLGVSGATVSQDGTRSIRATTPSGSAASSATPSWWDSSTPGSGPEGPAGDGGLRPLDHSATASSVQLDVSSATETPEVQYPVYVDPDWTGNVQAYWFTDRAYPNQSYLNGNQADGIQSVGNGGGYLSRAFWQFAVGSQVFHKHIISSRFNVTELYSNTCTAKPIQAWRYGIATPGFTWNTDPDQWVHLDDTLSLADGSSCAGAKLEGFNTGATAIWAAANSSSVVQIGLRAADETDTLTRRA